MRQFLQCNQATVMRRGFTLVELVVVITLMGMISVIGVQALTLLFEADSRSATSAVDQLMRERLADQFRRDVHQAISARTSDVPGTLQLDLADNMSIVYQFEDSRLTRRVLGKERTQPYETYRIDDVRCLFEVTPQLVTLTLETINDSTAMTHRLDIMDDVQPRRFLIHAILGKQHRFSPSTKNPEEAVNAE